MPRLNRYPGERGRETGEMWLELDAMPPHLSIKERKDCLKRNDPERDDKTINAQEYRWRGYQKGNPVQGGPTQWYLRRMSPSIEQIDEELKSLRRKGTATTEVDRIVKVRLGHSSWAKDIKSRAENCCQLQPRIKRNLVAGHIKPWSKCNDDEKHDRANGLCLSPNFDRLFEDGAISFADNGRLIIVKPDQDEADVYRLNPAMTIKVAEGQTAYLRWHRQEHGVDELKLSG